MGMTGEQAYVLAKKLIEAGGGGGGTVDAYTKTQTDNLLIKKVDKEVGKGLFSGSYNDLSDTPTIPSKTSELHNDSKYQTESDVTTTLSDYATKTYVGEQIASAEHLKREIITVLPSDTEASDNIIYMLKVESATGNDKYQEYMKIDGTVQMVGDTSVDLTDYAKTADIPTTLPADGGNADTVNNHTVESDVPVDAKFTDTIYDDTEVKGSIAELSSNLDTLKYSEVAGGKNLVDTSKATKGYWLDSGGKFNAGAGNNVTDYIEVSGNVMISGCVGISASFCWFDSNKAYISGISYSGNSTKIGTKPSNAKYIRASFTDTNANSFMIELEDSVTPYEPYIPSVKMLAEDVKAVNESLSVIGKCKNLLNPTFDTFTNNGITFTRNDDGSYSLSGSRTDTSSSAFVTIIYNLPLEKGKYKLTGAVDKNNYIRCMIKVSDSANRNIYDYGDGVVLDVKETGTKITLMIVTTYDTSQTRIIKPMLTTNLSANYDDFVPYTGDGDTLTHDVAELKNDLGGLTFSASGTTLTITDGANTWTLEANS